MQASGSASKPRQKGAPCVHCRQMKVKCDVHENFPAPCSRCGKSGRRCFVDPTFRRTTKRDRLETIEQEVRELRKQVPKAPEDNQSEFAGTTLSSHSNIGDAYDESSLASLLDQLRNQFTEFTNKAIDGVEVDQSNVADLLEEYYANYHVRFPLLQDPAACIKSYDTCPFLFWTVMAVASKRSHKYSYLHEQLRDPVTRLAAEHTKPANRQIAFVQALLLLCVWPFPYAQLRENPAWLYCGLATHMAMLLGLHRPQHPTQFLGAEDSEKGDINVRIRTWLSCFIVDQNTSAFFGVPATIGKSDNTILRALGDRPSEFADPVGSYLQIAHISSRYSTLLGQYENDSTGLLPDPLPIVRTLDTELGIFQTRNALTWSPTVEITFLGARLNLYSYALADVSHNSVSTSRRGEADAEYVPLSFMAATRLLHLACSFPDEVRLGTLHMRFCVIYAVLFLLRISRSSYRNLIDEAAAQNAISQTWAMLKKSSEVEGDSMTRICAIIEFVSKADWSKDAPMPTRSRMGGNFVIDVLILGAERHKKEAQEKQVQNMDEVQMDGEPDGRDFLSQFPDWGDTDFANHDPAVLEAEFHALFGAYGFP